MNKKTFSAVALATLLLTACQNDEETMQTDTRVALQVTSGIQTRAYDDQWEKGDEIGIFGFTQGDAPTQAYTNERYVTTGGNDRFTPGGTPIYLPTDDSYLDFVAYYPHTTSLTADGYLDFVAYYPHTTSLTADGIYAVDVTNQSIQKDIDLMAASKLSANRSKNTVAFNFEHKLSKIVLNFADGDGIAFSELAGMTVQLTNQQPKATFDVTQPDGEVVVGTDSPIDITLLTNADGTSSEGIVLPNEDIDNMTLRLELADGSSFFEWSLGNSSADKFEAGKKYVYDITVNRSGLGVTATITDWTPGNGENGEQGNAF